MSHRLLLICSLIEVNVWHPSARAADFDVKPLPRCSSALSSFPSTVRAGSGSDKIYGGGRLFGEGDRDIMFAGKSDDELHGGRDADIMMGREGADRFVYAEIADSAADQGGHWSAENGDTIMDFSPEQGDEIDLTALARAHPGGGAFYRWNGTDPEPWSVWTKPLYSDTIVFADTSGDDKADVAIRLIGSVAVQPQDFCGVAERN